MSNTMKDELLSILEPVGQEHILRYFDELDDSGRQKLSSQIKSIDWPKVMKWTKEAGEGLSADALASVIPAPYKPEVPETADDKALYEKAIKRGVELLKNGKVAAFTVAGGQGTRLGYNGPKGTYPVSAVKHKSLFQIFAEGILRNQKKYGKTIPWYIMTSVINDAPTRAFFMEHNFFGLDASQVMFFTQGMLPAFDLSTGKALLESKDSLALSPNGHGGSFQALHDSGALKDMLAKGITTLSYWQVDNPMIRQFDPLFIGLHDISGSEMSSRALIKRDAKEKLGHFCLSDGKLIIIEYSDMPDSLLYRTDADGRLSFRAGSPAIHVLSTSFIKRITDGTLSLKPHRAEKKVPHLDENGTCVKPESPNALKLEFFLFDALPLANSPLILEGNREEEFAPVKNPEGQDSPDSSRAAMNARAARWMDAAGIPFPRKADGTPDATVELSPAIFGSAEDVKANAGMFPSIKAGDLVYIG